MSSKNFALHEIIGQQKQEIEKYKNKLRDVVIAHRDLVKEKEALEKSLNALQKQRDGSCGEAAQNETEDAKQVVALVGTLNTLTAAKAKIEASYHAEKKQLREEKETAELKCDDLQKLVSRLELEVEEWKSKVFVERHEREKQQLDHGCMIKELQTLLASERRQTEALKDEKKLLADNIGVINKKEYENKIQRLQNELEVTRRKLELAEKKVKEPPLEIIKLQEKISKLQENHQYAIEEERRRAEQVEKRAKKQASLQEERVRNLETKLAELSSSVGTLDRLRQLDQAEIIKLKDFISMVTAEVGTSEVNAVSGAVRSDETFHQNIDQINILNDTKFNDEVHVSCMEELQRARRELEQYKIEMNQKINNVSKSPAVDKLIQSLQERIRVINEESHIRETEHNVEKEQWKEKLRVEKVRFKETLASAEADFRSRLNLLETQLHKLRERSMAMLEEKEQEIHSLQGNVQAFLPESRKEGNELAELTFIRDGPRILHYVNELARRDMEIAALRRSKQVIEAALHDQQRAASTLAETHRSEIQTLKDEIVRLSRCNTSGGASLEYLKNVVLSFLLTNDPCSKRHITNAIAAVLKFSDDEQERIAKQPHNVWWMKK